MVRGPHHLNFQGSLANFETKWKPYLWCPVAYFSEEVGWTKIKIQWLLVVLMIAKYLQMPSKVINCWWYLQQYYSKACQGVPRVSIFVIAKWNPRTKPPTWVPAWMPWFMDIPGFMLNFSPARFTCPGNWFHPPSGRAVMMMVPVRPHAGNREPFISQHDEQGY